MCYLVDYVSYKAVSTTELDLSDYMTGNTVTYGAGQKEIQKAKTGTFCITVALILALNTYLNSIGFYGRLAEVLLYYLNLNYKNHGENGEKYR